jgi:lipopolysaccharide export system permease protein
MTRVDLVILRRLSSRIGVTVVVLFGLIILAESLNVWRFQHLSRVGGPMLGLLAIVTEAGRWALGTLPVTLLIGAIIGLLDLQARRELTVIKASGLSIWRTLRAPLAAVTILGILASLVIDTAVVTVSRMLSINMPQANVSDALWLEQSGGSGENYVIFARHPHPGGVRLEDVMVFLSGAEDRARIHAPLIELRNGAWHIPSGTRYTPEQPPRAFAALDLPTTTTRGDMGVKLRSPVELTVFELWEAMQAGITAPDLRSNVEMRFVRLLSLPLVLMGSLLIAFAFTAGYQRTNKYGSAVLYGIVLGFVVYVVTEMAAMAGAAGIMEPGFAAVGPALLAMAVGATVLLYKEDGRI